MGYVSSVSWVDAAGYLASILVFATFCMRTMLPLRLVAIGSNLLFIVYGYMGGVYPVLLLHLVLLPMNVWRAIGIVRITRAVRVAAGGATSLDWLRPFTTRATLRPGEILFAKGDFADCMYFIVSGKIALEEIDRVIGPGELFGEVGLFSPERRRTQSARCIQAAELLSIDAQEIERVCVQRPEVAFTLLRLITMRLLSNQQSMMTHPQVSHDAPSPGDGRHA